MRDIEVGDKVLYSAAWVRNTGQVATNDDCIHTKGVVESFEALGSSTKRAVVTWPHGVTRRVNVLNLCLPLSRASVEGGSSPTGGFKLPEHMIRRRS